MFTDLPYNFGCLRSSSPDRNAPQRIARGLRVEMVVQQLNPCAEAGRHRGGDSSARRGMEGQQAKTGGGEAKGRGAAQAGLLEAITHSGKAGEAKLMILQ